MKAIVLCLICFLAVTNGASMLEKYEHVFSFSQKRSIMNVMTQVEATIKAGGPLDAITRILAEFEQELRNEQIAHDALYEKQTKECKEEFEFRAEEIKDGTEAGEEARERLATCEAQKKRAEIALVQAKKNLKQKTAELINVHSTRTREKYDFDTKKGAYQRIRPAIDECIGFIEKIFTGDASFLQVAKHTNKMLVTAVKLGHSHKMAPILSALAQLASSGVQADTELLEKLTALFQNFAAELDAAKIKIDAAEDAAVKKYTADVARLKGCIAKLEETIRDLKAEIAAMKKCITVQTNRINSADAKVLRNSQLLTAAKNMCAAMDKQYAQAKKGRFEGLELLDAIKVKVTEHYAKLSAGVVSRGKLDDFDSTYKNKSKYVKKEFKA